MTNQLITYRLPIDYSLISFMSSISYVWNVVSEALNVRFRKLSLCEDIKSTYAFENFNSAVKRQCHC